jgi:hypothetical protein
MSLAHRGVLFPEEIEEFPGIMEQTDPFVLLSFLYAWHDRIGARKSHLTP